MFYFCIFFCEGADEFSHKRDVIQSDRPNHTRVHTHTHTHTHSFGVNIITPAGEYVQNNEELIQPCD